MERLRFSRAEIDARGGNGSSAYGFQDVPRMRVAKLKRFMARPTFEEELELHRVDARAVMPMLGQLRISPAPKGRVRERADHSATFGYGERPDRAGNETGSKLWGNPGSSGNAPTRRRLFKTREEALDWVKRDTVERKLNFVIPSVSRGIPPRKL